MLVIAYGNPLRSDDGLAWIAAEKLEDHLGADVEIHCCQQLMPELAELISQSQLVVFVDATTVGTPGEVFRVKVAKTAANSGGGSHQLNPVELIALSQALYGSNPKAFSVTMCGQNFEHGDTCSAPVSAAIPELVRTVTELVNEMGSDEKS